LQLPSAQGETGGLGNIGFCVGVGEGKTGRVVGIVDGKTDGVDGVIGAGKVVGEIWLGKTDGETEGETEDEVVGEIGNSVGETDGEMEGTTCTESDVQGVPANCPIQQFSEQLLG